MKLLCSCGHPNLLHFAGTGHCHAVTGVIELTESLRCSCEAFVLDESALELVRERKDVG